MLETHGAGLKIQGRWLWRGLDLVTMEGQVLGLLGPNGVGKTTLLRCLTGLRQPTEGQITRPNVIGYVPQNSEIGFAYTARDVVAMGLAAQKRLFENLNQSDEARIDAALTRTEALSFSDRAFTTLSGGERQLVLIARALVTGARHIVLDEPMSALDLRHQSLVLRMLQALAHEDGLAVLFAAHDPNHLLAAADQTLVLSPGLPPAQGPTYEMLSEERLSNLYGLPVGVSSTELGRHVLPNYI